MLAPRLTWATGPTVLGVLGLAALAAAVTWQLLTPAKPKPVVPTPPQAEANTKHADPPIILERRFTVTPFEKSKDVLKLETGPAGRVSVEAIPSRITSFATLPDDQLALKLASVGLGLREFDGEHHAKAKKIAESVDLNGDEANDRAQSAASRDQLAVLHSDDTLRFRTLYLEDARDLVDEASKRLDRPRPTIRSPGILSPDGAQALASGQMYGSGLSNLADYLDALAAGVGARS